MRKMESGPGGEFYIWPDAVAAVWAGGFLGESAPAATLAAPEDSRKPADGTGLRLVVLLSVEKRRDLVNATQKIRRLAYEGRYAHETRVRCYKFASDSSGRSYVMEGRWESGENLWADVEDLRFVLEGWTDRKGHMTIGQTLLCCLLERAHDLHAGEDYVRWGWDVGKGGQRKAERKGRGR